MNNTSPEIWKNIPDFPNYQVSNRGRVKRLPHKITFKTRSGNRITRSLSECILKPKRHSGHKGYNEQFHYVQFSMKNTHGQVKYPLAHRLVAQAFIPNPDNKPQVDHLNEDKTDNRVENLRWVTNKENHNSGTGHQRTAQHPNSLLHYQKFREQVLKRLKDRANLPRCNCLIVGDIHAKPWVVDKIENLLPEYDKIIFLGDYEDDWLATPEMSYSVVKRLIDFKKAYVDKIVLLMGNHTYSEWLGGTFRCSGFNILTHSLVKDLYETRGEDGEPIFQMAYSKGQYLFTHAGVTNTFWKEMKLLIRNHYPELQELLTSPARPTAVSNILNYAFLKGIENPTDKLFSMMKQVGSGRGGYETPSPLWADREELIADPIPGIKQVVGHTPVKSVELYIDSQELSYGATLIFCDTLSTRYLPYIGVDIPIGDYSLLQLNFSGKTNRPRITTLTKQKWLWSTSSNSV